jgi:YbbR domain-containing protein
MRDLLLKDLGWKLFSLFLAVIIWLTVNRILHESFTPADLGNGNTLTYGSLPVVIVSTSEDVHLYRVAPDTVSVTVSGTPDTISVLQANQIRVTVDLTDIGSGSDLKRRVDVSVPPGVTLVSVDPQKVGVIMPPPSPAPETTKP